MKIISVLNYKGGVGKTTLTACVAQALALAGHRVLAIDNDHQHNLSIMLGQTTSKPTIRDVYLSAVGIGGRNLLKAIHHTTVRKLDVVISETDLANDDVKDPFILNKCITYAKLKQTYDYILIDNGPGLDRLQQASLHASDSIIVPTELSHFAIGGVYDMHRALLKRFQESAQITCIVPVFYRGTKQQCAYLLALGKLFPGKVTDTLIPFDSVFDGLAEHEKVLFLHRFSSKAADNFLKLVQELFDQDQKELWSVVRHQRDEQLRKEATERLVKARSVRAGSSG